MSEEKGQNRGWLWAGGVLAWKLARSVARPVSRVLMGKRIHRVGEIEGTRGAEEEPRRVSDAVMLGLEATALTQALRDTFEEIHEQGGEESSERDNDRNVDAERGVNVEEREKWGTALIVFWLVLSFAAGIAFLFTYWTGGNNLILGGTLGVFFGCFGIALIVWSHSLIPHTEAIEPRQPLAAPTPEFQSAMGDFTRGYHQIRRRNLLKWASVAGAGMLAAVFISFLRSMGHPPDSLYTRVWNQGQRLMKFDGTPVTVDALQPGSTMIVFPEGSEDTETAQTVLLRVRPELLRLPASRSTWAPNGYLAYSRVCTHAGCTVGMYERTSHLLMCPCHQSTFDVLIGAQPTGGPAARPLPQLPLYADDRGFLRAGGGFTEPPGPGFWGMP